MYSLLETNLYINKDLLSTNVKSTIKAIYQKSILRWPMIRFDLLISIQTDNISKHN